jgi:glycosyltransferase involved in cell wall biosynthesis
VTVSLILPVLNREDRLVEVLEQIQSTLANIKPEVVVVYDVTSGLLGAVEAEQRELEERYAIRSVTRLNQRGFGSALREGFQTCSGQVIIPIMADYSDDIAVIPKMLAKIEDGADVVAGCRYMPGGGIVGDTIKQRFSRLYSKVMQMISRLPCQDVSNSFKAYRREVWENVACEANSFDFSVEITVKAAVAGYRISEVPAVWTNRQAGRSQFGMFRELPNYGQWLLFAAARLPSRFFLVSITVGTAALVLLALRPWPGRGRRRGSVG